MDNNIVFPIFYLGPIEYYYQLLNSSTPILENYEHFVKQTYRNRCSIYGANGKLNLIIPLHRTGNRRIVKDILVSQNENWQILHWRSLQSAYRSSPYFEFYEDDFAPFYEKKYKFLIDFNLELLNKTIELLDITKNFKHSHSYESIENVYDFRNKFDAKQKPKLTSLKDKEYIQVFSNKHGFLENLSIVDLLFNEGPNSINYIKSLT